MSASESDFIADSSSACEEPRASSRRLGNVPKSPRKRRRSPSRVPSRSPSPEQLRISKIHLNGQYNDAYRSLFNETVTSAAARFDLTDSFYHDFFHPLEGQVGASIWSLEEKSMFYAALERLGQDDVLGIAKAIGTKSIPETRELLLILRDATKKQGYTRLTLRDIPAAVDMSSECSERLELAGDALAWYQEQFEAKEEEKRYGEYWLITPEVADTFEDAFSPSRYSSVVSASSPELRDENAAPPPKEVPISAPILKEIPEGNLLHISTLLKLSSSIFMNPSPDLPSASPHWLTLGSPLASKPSMYHTALSDFHSLVVSITKRLTQASIMQATSRIRSQGWRATKGANSLVKKRDALTAIDMLGLKRNGRERWRSAARRCGLRVFDGAGKAKREVNWNEVEEILAVSELSAEAEDTNAAITDVESGLEEEDFKARAVRSGTPLPPEHLEDSDSDQDDHPDKEYEDESSDVDDSFVLGSPASTKGSRASPEFEPITLEDFDREASRNEEARLWHVIGASPPSNKMDPLKHEHGMEESELKGLNKIVVENDSWRSWTQYRSSWEDLRTPVPAAKFRENQKRNSPFNRASMERPGTEYDTHGNYSSDADVPRDGRPKKRRKTSEHEIPIRGTRAYAALLEERISVSGDGDEGSSDSYDDSKMLAQSIEDV
ncbi:hypothetical protein K504DRAFT_461741 [Pleomassaria siparia CBS 279.74]|uniref:Myb-like domain-containing protein n=1 Tax=Pleomassaria siparia CBS 279.74 TaxID=1314801 RepID=A0A6G1KK08_9PLEO|nr:hypothetical protein K504DRAFT_461741 [Pleomassaria siparia CBS 279.74]